MTVHPGLLGMHCILPPHWTLLRAQGLQNGVDGEGDNNKSNKVQENSYHHHWLPRSRHKHSACCLREYVYVVGGKDGTVPLRDIWRIHIKKQFWELMEPKGSCLPYLQGHTTVVNKKLIFIFGGTFSGIIGDIQLWVYNSDLDYLKEIWIEPGNVQPTCRRDHSAVMFNNVMYVYGGFVDQTGSSQEFWAFSTEDEEWTEVNSRNKIHPGKRHGHSAVVAGNSMWLYGGMAGLTPRSDLWCYSFSLQQWKKVKGLGNPPTLKGHTAVVVKNHMIITGGSCEGKFVSDMWAYSFETMAWLKLQQPKFHALPKLCYHASVVYASESSEKVRSLSVQSTPQLKSTSKYRLRRDHFLVRPRSSPLGAREGQDPAVDSVSCDASIPGVVAQEVSKTQVLTLNLGTPREEWSRDLCDENSTNRSGNADARININDKEPLLMREESGEYYDTLLWDRHSSFQGEVVVADSIAGCEHYPLNRLCASQSFPEHLVLKPQAHYNRENDSSTSPGLAYHKAPSEQELSKIRNVVQSGSTSGRWDDVYLEDLECTNEHNGLSEVQISYPSRNPIQQLFSVAEFDHHDSHSWYTHGPHCMHEPGIELQQLKFPTGTNPFSNNTYLPFCHQSSHLEDSIGERFCSVPIMPQQSLEGRIASTDVENAFSPKVTNAAVTVEHLINQHKHQQKCVNLHSVLPELKYRLVTTGTQTENSVQKEGNKASCFPVANFKVAGITEVRTPEETDDEPIYTCDIESKEPFILVLGGCMEEAGSLYPKPLKAWKGILL